MERGDLHRHGRHLGATCAAAIRSAASRRARSTSACATRSATGCARSRDEPGQPRLRAASGGARTCTAARSSTRRPTWSRVCSRASASSSRACAASCARPSSSARSRSSGYTGTHDPAGLYLLAGPAVRGARRAATSIRSRRSRRRCSSARRAGPEDHRGRRHGRARCGRSSSPRIRVRFGSHRSDEAATATAGWRSGEDEAQVAEHLRALGYFE